jgi:hypothetical protein
MFGVFEFAPILGPCSTSSAVFLEPPEHLGGLLAMLSGPGLVPRRSALRSFPERPVTLEDDEPA